MADFCVVFFCGANADFSSAPCFMHSGKTLSECGCPNICASDEWQAEQCDTYWRSVGREMAKRQNDVFMKAMFGDIAEAANPE
jgi:hypothetical protein